MKANQHTTVAVRMPLELRDVLENMAQARGETVSLIVRDLVRQAVVDARRVDQGIPKVLASADTPRPRVLELP